MSNLLSVGETALALNVSTGPTSISKFAHLSPEDRDLLHTRRLKIMDDALLRDELR